MAAPEADRRQDIRELRADNKTLRDKIDGNYTALDKKIDVTTGELRADMKQMQAGIADIRAWRTVLAIMRAWFGDQSVQRM